MADDDATARPTTKATAGGPAKKVAARKVTGAAASAKKSSTANAAAPGAAVKRAAVKKAAVKKAPAARARVTESPVYKAPPRKAAASSAAVKKTPAKRTTGVRDAGAVLAPRKKAPPPLRLAAEQTFDDDNWQTQAPEPERDDPADRMRGILRAAALSLEAKDAGAAPATPRPAASPPQPTDEPVTRVLVAPEPDLHIEDLQTGEQDLEDEWIDEEDVDDDLAQRIPVVQVDVEDPDNEEEWSAPEVLDDLAPSPSPPPSPPAEPPPPTTQVIMPPAPAPAAPERKKPRRGRRLLLVLLVLAVAAAAVFAFLALRDNGVDYSELKVGDCFDSSQSSEVRTIKVEPCSEPHNSEIFFLVQHPAGPDEAYPGRDALVQFAADACLGQPLTDYLGVPLEQSSLKDFEIVPQESAWEDGRRVLVCGIDTGGGADVTASVKGSRR